MGVGLTVALTELVEERKAERPEDKETQRHAEQPARHAADVPVVEENACHGANDRQGE